jgi:hypothetical protein
MTACGVSASRSQHGRPRPIALYYLRDAAAIPVPECGQRLTRNRLSRPVSSYEPFKTNHLEARFSPKFGHLDASRKHEGSSLSLSFFVL